VNEPKPLSAIARVDALDWPRLQDDLNEVGHARTAELLDPAACRALRAMFDEPRWFRSTVDMTRHRFGSGTYRLHRPGTWPDTLDAWLERCHAAGQTRPTPLMLSYRAGDWNALHQDRYGELVFPFQVVIGLDRPGVDHDGGEFLMLEQRPRAQSRGFAATVARATPSSSRPSTGPSRRRAAGGRRR